MSDLQTNDATSTMYSRFPEYDGERALASIQQVVGVRPIEGADNIELIDVLGWQVVSQKGLYAPGDLVVFLEIDSLLPLPDDRWSFLEKCNGRIKTIRLRGELSQGLVLPTSILAAHTVGEPNLQLGTNVTQILGVKKYDRELLNRGGDGRKFLSGDAAGPWPCWIPKTDEVRIQSWPVGIEALRGLPYYVTQKLDGTSATYTSDADGNFLACSRNFPRKEGTNVYWDIANKYGIAHICHEFPHVAIQGEIVGPGIQGNPLGLEEVDYYVFNILDRGELVNLVDSLAFCQTMGLKFVPIIEQSTTGFQYDLAQLLELAKGTYPNGKDQEGIVIRPLEPTWVRGGSGGRLSFKAINNDYLLKEK